MLIGSKRQAEYMRLAIDVVAAGRSADETIRLTEKGDPSRYLAADNYLEIRQKYDETVPQTIRDSVGIDSRIPKVNDRCEQIVLEALQKTTHTHVARSQTF